MGMGKGIFLHVKLPAQVMPGSPGLVPTCVMTRYGRKNTFSRFASVVLLLVLFLHHCLAADEFLFAKLFL